MDIRDIKGGVWCHGAYMLIVHVIHQNVTNKVIYGNMKLGHYL